MSSSNSRAGEIINGLFVWAFAILAFAAMLAVPTAAFMYQYAPKQWYELRYSDSVNVTVQDKPQDCDYDFSPLGKKGCHYEKLVTVVTTEPNNWGGKEVFIGGEVILNTSKDIHTGLTITSVDLGKTWDVNTNYAVPQDHVDVDWVRRTD
jgi:hypothetical protein